MAGEKRRHSDGHDEPVLLSGGNPQIAKGDGEAVVSAYIDAMPGWKHDVGARLHALIVDAAPDVDQAVRWNQPLYGIEGQGWIVSFRCFTKYVKVTFFAGASLQPEPPESGKDKHARFLHLQEGVEIDEQQFASWVEQAALLPGWDGS